MYWCVWIAGMNLYWSYLKRTINLDLIYQENHKVPLVIYRMNNLIYYWFGSILNVCCVV